MNKKPKILVVGSITMDLISTTTKFPDAGESIIGGTFSNAPGGKGTNQAVQAAKLGASVTLVGKVGNDEMGKTLTNAAASHGVDVSRVYVSEKTATAVADIQIQSNENGTENRILILPGANMDLTADDVAFLENDMKNYDMVMLQLEIPMEINCIVAKYAKAAGVPVMLNPAPSDKLPPELLACVTYISPNEHEAFDITGIRAEGSDGVKTCVEKLRSMGVESALITLGKNGCVFCNGNEPIYSPCVNYGKVVDPTAAGDSFIGAFCTAISSGISIKSALVFANCVGCLTVSKMGAQTSLSTLDEVFDLMDKVGIDKTAYEKMK